MISLVIVNYNQERYIGKAIASILAQTRRDWDLLIWDDGSTDNSVTIAREYEQQNNRIRVIAAQHQGVAKARKQAIAETTGNYFGYIDSDDWIANTALEETARVLDSNPEVGMVYTDYYDVNSRGKVLGKGKRCYIPYSPQRLLVDFMTFHFRLLRREVYRQIEEINFNCEYADDYDLCLRLSEVTKFKRIQKPLYYYRHHGQNISYRKRKEQIKCSKIAINRALQRRGLADTYVLEVKGDRFCLRKKETKVFVPLAPKIWGEQSSQNPPNIGGYGGRGFRGSKDLSSNLLKTAATLITVLPFTAAIAVNPASAQSIIPNNDGTMTVITKDGSTFNIDGGTLSGDGKNLFHSFREFGLDAGEIANFLSNPNIQNILGRINGGNPSLINGLIQVTGGNSNLFLMNPSGIIFGNNASLNVPGDFSATTATGIGFGDGWFNAVGTNDYLNLVGNPDSFNFTNAESGVIINAGDLKVADGSNISLTGGTVINTGTIETEGGNITVAAVPGTNRVLISQEGQLLKLEVAVPQNANGEALPIRVVDLPNLLRGLPVEIETGLEVAANNDVTVANSNTVIPNEPGTTIVSGTVDVSNTQPGGVGGEAQLLGGKVGLIGANIDASGDAGGGEVLVGGDYKGQGTVHNAEVTLVDRNSEIKADARQDGDGGEVIVWADKATRFYGNITARGGQLSGNGGFVETSGKEYLEATGNVDASAPQGQAGTWLLDPNNILIQDADPIEQNGNDNVNIGIDTSNPNVEVFTTTNDSAILRPTSIEASLDSGTDVTVTTGTAGNNSQEGNITVASNIEKIDGGDASLTLQANNDIIINEDVQISSNFNILNVTLNADRDANNAGAIQMNPGSAIFSNGGNIILGGGLNPSTAPAFGTGDGIEFGQAQGIVIDGATINSAGGNIILSGTGYAGGSDNTYGIGIFNSQITSGTGNITLNGTGGEIGNRSDGILLNTGSIIQSTGTGIISLTGVGASGGQENSGIDIRGGSSITSSNGDIELNGTGGSSTETQNEGIILTGGSTIQSTGTGAISLDGTGGDGAGGNNYGILIGIDPSQSDTIGTNSQVTSSSGTITLDGTGEGTGSNNYGIFINNGGAVISTEIGAISLTGISSGGISSEGSQGIRIFSSGARVSSQNGNISLTGTGGNGTGGLHRGINITSGAVVESTGNGNLTLVGTGGTGGDIATPNEGILIQDTNSVVSSVNGDINLVGNATGNNNPGIGIDAGGLVRSTGTGSISLRGTNADADGIRLSSGSILGNSSAITLTSDEIDLFDPSTTITGDTVTIQPETPDLDITLSGLGYGTLGLDITQDELDNITANSLLIGRSDGIGTLTIDSDGIFFLDPVTLQAGNIEVNGLLEGRGDASITLIGAETTTTLNADITTEGQPIEINDNVILGTGVTLNTTEEGFAGANIIIDGTVNNDPDPDSFANFLILTAGTGEINITGAIGNTNPIGFIDANSTSTTNFGSIVNADSLFTDADGITILNGNITTTDSQFYGDAVELGQDIELVGGGYDSITFNSTVRSPNTPRSLTITANEEEFSDYGIAFNGAVGDNNQPLLSLETNSNTGETTFINGGSVTTTGDQTYNDAVLLGEDTTLTGANITFNNTIDAGEIDGEGYGEFIPVDAGLTVNASETTTFGNDISDRVGETNPLTFLTTNAPGTTVINTDQINTTGDQTYNDAVELGEDTTLTGNNITFNNTVDAATNGEQSLTVNASGNTTFGNDPSDRIGETNRLESLTTDAVGTTLGTTVINTDQINTTGDQTYNDTVILGASTTLTSEDSNITLNQVDFNGVGNSTFTIQAGDNINLNGAIADSEPGDDSLNLDLTANTNNDNTGAIAIAQPINTQGGNISITNTSVDNVAIDIQNPLNSNGGDITLNGTSTNNTGVLIDSNVNSNSDNNGGNINITGTSVAEDGVFIRGQVTTSGTGTINVTGTSTEDIGILTLGNNESTEVIPTQITTASGEINLTGTSTNSIGVSTQTTNITSTDSNVTLTGDEIDLLTGTNITGDTVTLQPETSESNIAISPTEESATDLDITQAELDTIEANSITIGNATDGSGTITVANPITLDESITLNSSQTNLNGDITTEGNEITINGDVTLQNNVALNAISNEETGTNININGSVNGANNLTLNAGSGNINLQGNVGNTTPLGSLQAIGTIRTSGNGLNITANDISTENIDTTNNPGGNATLNSTAGAIVTGDIDTSGTTGGNVTLNSANTIETGAINSSGSEGNGGDVTLNSGEDGNIRVDSIRAEGNSNNGGDIKVNVDNNNPGLFVAESSFPLNGVATSIFTNSSSSEAITIKHGGNGEIPFEVGNPELLERDRANGTVGAIIAGNNQINDESFLFTERRDNISIISVEAIDNNEIGNFESQPTPIQFFETAANIAPPQLPIPSISEAKKILRRIEEQAAQKPALVYISFTSPEIKAAINKPEEYFVRAETCLTAEYKEALGLTDTQVQPTICLAPQPSDRLEIVVITAEGEPIFMPVDVTRAEVEKQAEDLYREVANREELWEEPAELLYEWLISSIEEQLKARDIDNLLFVLPPKLRSLPLATLYDFDTDLFLIEKGYNIGLAPSVNLMNTVYNKDVQNASVLALGASNFEENQNQQALNAVEVELPEIVSLRGGQTSAFNEQFTLENLRTSLNDNDFPIVHLSTHADFSTATIDDIYIQLYDRRLTLNELRSLDLKVGSEDLELLVLSACRSAFGDTDAELGFAGLAVKLGVKTAIGSLWKVSDVTTPGLMLEFYHQLETSTFKAEALRLAQVAMIEEQIKIDLDNRQMVTSWGETIELPENVVTELLARNITEIDLSHPYYWAPFTVIGSPW